MTRPPIVALHGVPTGPTIWSRVDVGGNTPLLTGNLAQQVADVEAMLTPETIVIGHDMGGIVAALAALHSPPRAVVLTGTALGPYWAVVRASAWPGLWRYFYGRHAGRKFVAGAVSPERSREALAAFPGADPLEMRAIARSMRPPADLARRLAGVTKVFLVWGQRDRWYPPIVARGLARATRANIRWVPGGHFCMWEEPVAYQAAILGICDEIG